jgi:thiamine pyrophosphate-dependent acetolactate synthase large subunit-like protein
MRGADALVRTLAESGVQRLFTLSGNHVMPVFDAALDAGLALLHTRHEAAAVHMADAWARLSGVPGVALVTGGPGHANAVGALYTALMAESPMVLLSGHAPHRELGRGAFQEMQQAHMAMPVTKASWTCASVRDVVHDVRRALHLARSGRAGPVHLSLPVDVLEDDDAPSPSTTPVQAREVVPDLPADAAQAIAAALTRARRPLILGGPASCTPAGRRAMGALEAALGVPCVATESPRGVNDPALGRFASILLQADCVLLLEKRLDFTLGFGGSPPFAAHCAFVQVDPDASELARTRRAVQERLVMAVVADRVSAMRALAATGARGSGADWRDEVAQALRWRPPQWRTAAATRPGAVHPVEMCAPIQALLDTSPDAVLVCDGGEIGQWAQACLSAPRRVINGMAGSIGSGVPFALAARIAEPHAPVVSVMGDGTFGFHLAEYDTAMRYALPFVAVVGNDACWNAEYQIQLRSYGAARAHGCELRPMRYDLVTAAFGGHGEHVETAAAMASALARAQAAALPACVNVALEGLPAPVMR